MSPIETFSVESDVMGEGPLPSTGRVRGRADEGRCRPWRTPAAPLPSGAAEQRLRDGPPFLFERIPAHRLLCAAVPVGGVPGVAFLSMQIGVDPVARAAFVGLRGVVRAIPVALGVQPEGAKGVAECRRRLGGG